jgi:hypothetical protein
MRLGVLFLLALLFVCALPLGGNAHEYRLGPLLIVHPSALSFVPGRPVSVYLTIVNNSATPDRLIGVASPAAERAELHAHEMTGAVVQMKKIEAIDIPANGKAEFRRGGLHIMLFGLAKPVAPGDRIPLELQFEAAGRIAVEAYVERPSGEDTHTHGHSQTDTQQ